MLSCAASKVIHKYSLLKTALLYTANVSWFGNAKTAANFRRMICRVCWHHNTQWSMDAHMLGANNDCIWMFVNSKFTQMDVTAPNTGVCIAIRSILLAQYSSEARYNLFSAHSSWRMWIYIAMHWPFNVLFQSTKLSMEPKLRADRLTRVWSTVDSNSATDYSMVVVSFYNGGSLLYWWISWMQWRLSLRSNSLNVSSQPWRSSKSSSKWATQTTGGRPRCTL